MRMNLYESSTLVKLPLAQRTPKGNQGGQLVTQIRADRAIPEGLIQAASLGTLVPFIGAGASSIAGCPRWGEFADRALDSLVRDGTLSAAQRSQLSSLSPRVKLSVAKLTAARAGSVIRYRDILHPSKEWSAHSEGRRLYGYISALSSRFVTTNYDDWLNLVLPLPELDLAPTEPTKSIREEQQRQKLDLPEDITADRFLTPNTVVHLHGSLDDPSKMIMSTSDYIHRYANDRILASGDRENPVLRFLEYLFQENTVLFIGYGLEELEILEYVIMKARASGEKKSNVAKHYLLQGFFSFEADLLKYLQDYFLEECGIELIPFSRDRNDWMQLTEVVKSFAMAMPKNDKVIVQELAEMEAFARG